MADRDKTFLREERIIFHTRYETFPLVIYRQGGFVIITREKSTT